MKKKKFNLNNFLLDDDDLSHIQKPIIPVCKPNIEFRIHPDTERVATVLLYLVGKTWYLVNPNAVKNFTTNKLDVAELYEGIDKYGNSFLMPSTVGNYRESMNIVVRTARKQWVKVETFTDVQEHIATPISTRLRDPSWPEHTLEEVTEWAFRDRIINTYEDAAKIFEKKKSHRKIIEGDDE